MPNNRQKNKPGDYDYLCCIDRPGWCNGCTTCTDGKPVEASKDLSTLVCMHCKSSAERITYNPEVGEKFVVLFKCGRLVHNNPHPDPWVKEEKVQCPNK